MASTPTRSHTYRGRTIRPCSLGRSRNWYVVTIPASFSRAWSEQHSPQFDTLAEAKRHIDEEIALAAPDPVVEDAARNALVVARIAEIGQREVARRVAPLWGRTMLSAEHRLSRYVHGRQDMASDAFLALLDVLGLAITEKTT